MSYKKIPIIKIDTNTFKEIINHQFQLERELLENIKNRTTLYNGKQITCLIITDSKSTIAYKFNHNGINIESSSLLLEDDFDVIESSIKLPLTIFNIKKVKKINYEIYTRKQIGIRNYLLKHINKIDYDQLKYIYYDCFNKKEENYHIMLKVITNEIYQYNDIINTKIYDILKLVSTN